jgi:hypothetical protein
MTGLGTHTRAAVLSVAALALLAGGCGTQPVVQSQRADVTAAAPPDGSQVAAETPKPHRNKHKHHKPAKPKPGVWPVMHDRKSGVSFALPTASGAALEEYPAAKGGMTHGRNYAANTRDDLTLAVAVEDTSSFKPSYLEYMKPATAQWLTSAGATNVADAGGSRRVTVGGQPAYEYGLLFDNIGVAGRRGMIRVTVIALPHHLVIAETYSALGAERTLRQGHVVAVHERLMAGLRLA